MKKIVTLLLALAMVFSLCACGQEAPAAAKATLFARQTCPNCRIAEQQLTKAGFPFEKLIAEEHRDLVEKFGIKGAPTLVIEDAAGVRKYYGVPEIKAFLKEQ